MLDCIKEAVTMKTAIIFAIVCLAFANAQFGGNYHLGEGRHGEHGEHKHEQEEHHQGGGLSGMLHGGLGQSELIIFKKKYYKSKFYNLNFRFGKSNPRTC